MNKYKVEITSTSVTFHCFDVLAENETEAEKIAHRQMYDAVMNGTLHYHESREEEGSTSVEVYDVTDTDDQFNPEN